MTVRFTAPVDLEIIILVSIVRLWMDVHVLLFDVKFLFEV